MSTPIDPTTPAALDAALRAALLGLGSAGRPVAPLAPDDGDRRLEALYRAQITSRQLDLVARWMRSEHGRGYYTIGSAGHESNAAVALATRTTDPALLHYRSGAFYAARAAQAGRDPVPDVLLGMLGCVDEPIAGGRHKVIGHEDLSIIPQTSTIASHLPRAVGVAFAIGRAPKLSGLEIAWPTDSVAVCSFGDASANHSTAAGAINAAAHAAHQRLPLPLVFVCEDNGIGISVRTPPSWIEAAYGHRPGLRYERVDGHDPAALLSVVSELVDWARVSRRPAFLHLRTVRFLGHAGSDAESAYRSADEVRASFDLDPIIATAQLLVGTGRFTGGELLAQYDAVGVEARSVAVGLFDRACLTTPDEVMAPLAPRRPEVVAAAITRSGAVTSATAPAARELTLAQAINGTLAEVLAARPGVLVFGEDVAAKGGVYGVTKGLLAQAGAARVFDTILDEQSILGLALGTSIAGLLPIPEIQYLAYLHNAEDQLRGEAATMAFFSNGAYRNGMVVRIAGYGYQKGFGGHFHNDDAVAVLRDIPGLVIASPGRPGDAAAMLRTCIAAAAEDGTVSVFLEPIARYHTTDLHDPGDRGWLEADMGEHVPIGSSRCYGDGRDLLIVTWANGLFLSLRVAARLARAHGIRCRVLDLRWLAPLPIDEVLAAADIGRVLVVDETRRSGGVSEGIIAGLVDAGYDGAIARVASKDSFVPLGAAADLVLVSEDEIEAAALALARGRRRDGHRVRLRTEGGWTRRRAAHDPTW
ncbi:MAG: thiamine pyrophosphate-dependent enzyme [Acidimicrobiia bacterium]